MSRRSSVIDFSFPENNGGNDKERPPLRHPPRPPWRADLLILLAASVAALGTFLFEAWERTHPSTVVKSGSTPEIAQPRPPG